MLGLASVFCAVESWDTKKKMLVFFVQLASPHANDISSLETAVRLVPRHVTINQLVCGGG